MSLRESTPTIREWLGFTVWIVVVCALVYGAVKWRDRVLRNRPAEPVQFPVVVFQAPVTNSQRPQIAAGRPMPAAPPARAPDYNFYTIEPAGHDARGNPLYQRKGHYGVECTTRYQERGIVLSEFQGNYPAPLSGCGPTAILDWLIWYQNTGLLPRSTDTPDVEVYKRTTFALIDRQIAELRGRARTDFEGSNTMEIAVVFDRLVSELSRGRIRLACEIKDAPLSKQDLLNETHQYRAGILLAQVYDPMSPPWGGFHAVAVVRTDTEGRVSIANWGHYFNGSLIEKSDGQWFGAEDGSCAPLKIKSLMTFIPFRPTGE